MNWEEKLNVFLETFEHKEDIVGILVCGSYITGNPSTHSDLDVHLILDEKVDYRERGNQIVEGLLIEYFANPPRQIRKYFEEDYHDVTPMSQTQFITGKILLDKTGEVQALQEEARKMLDQHYHDVDTNINDLSKYGIWDMLDDLKDGFENGREDFDFLYYCNLDKLLSLYMKQIKHPYHTKTILGNITSEIVRKKYLLEELPDEDVKILIQNCIVLTGKEERMKNYEYLTNKIFDLTGGFDIDQFRFKSPVEC